MRICSGLRVLRSSKCQGFLLGGRWSCGVAQRSPIWRNSASVALVPWRRCELCDTADIIQALSAFVLAPWLAWNGLPKAMAGFPTFSKVFFTSLV